MNVLSKTIFPFPPADVIPEGLRDDLRDCGPFCREAENLVLIVDAHDASSQNVNLPGNYVNYVETS